MYKHEFLLACSNPQYYNALVLQVVYPGSPALAEAPPVNSIRKVGISEIERK